MISSTSVLQGTGLFSTLRPPTSTSTSSIRSIRASAAAPSRTRTACLVTPDCMALLLAGLDGGELGMQGLDQLLGLGDALLLRLLDPGRLDRLEGRLHL